MNITDEVGCVYNIYLGAAPRHTNRHGPLNMVNIFLVCFVGERVILGTLKIDRYANAYFRSNNNIFGAFYKHFIPPKNKYYAEKLFLQIHTRCIRVGSDRIESFGHLWSIEMIGVLTVSGCVSRISSDRHTYTLCAFK